MSLGRRIRELRIKKKITQQYIADKLGMGRSNFGHIENDRVKPSSEDLQIIADILETSTDYLLGRHEAIQQNQDFTESQDGIKAWLRINSPELTEEEAYELAEELEDYLRTRKERILKDRNKER